MSCRIVVCGRLPRPAGLTRGGLASAAAFFAAKSAARSGLVFREVAVVLQGDAASAEVHEAVNGAAGPTDVVTQRYDPMPGEEPGVYGELYVNIDRAVSAAPHRRGWNAARELLLYVAHGMDHLAGEDDLTDRGYAAMRRRELKWIADFGKITGQSHEISD